MRRYLSIAALNRVVAAVALSSALLLGLASFRPSAASQPALRLVVIANSGVPEKRLDADELRAVFLRKRLAWSDGKPVIAINQPNGGPVRLAFDRTVLGFDADQVARYWIDARIRSGMQAPRSVPGDSMVVRVIAALAGTIGYVPAGLALTGTQVVARIEAGRVLPP